jgi:hypothetical protein
MCKTYNMIGSLATLKSRLEENYIRDFKSLKEVIEFQSSFVSIKQQLISQHEELIEKERIELVEELILLDSNIESQKQLSEQILKDEIEWIKKQLKELLIRESTNVFQKLIRGFKQWNYKKQIKLKESYFDQKVEQSISNLVDNYQIKNNRYQFIELQFSEAVKQSSRKAISELERKKSVIDNLNSFIYGALGEQKVVKKIETLSDDYFLINDFAISFSPAIYNSQNDDYIKTIQIDHILVGPSGIFIIETKNWSEKSIENLTLHSPVQQIKRTNFVLFKLLNNDISNQYLSLEKHHWGDKKISIKNLIVLINKRPVEEFQYVKILTLNELLGYINYFKPVFSTTETQRIVQFLLRINEQKTITI